MTATVRYVDFTGDRTIESLSEAVRVLGDLFVEWNIVGDKTKSLWFRGQSNFDRELVPGLYRGGARSRREREMVRDFKLHAPRYLADPPASELGWITLMQHYGLPTRLLDWSESYLTALFFAVRSCSAPCDAALWAIRPMYLNEASLGVQSIPVETDPCFKRYVLPDPRKKVTEVEAALPAAFRPIWNSARISSQRGVFTIHGKDKGSLNEVIERMDAEGKPTQAVKYRIPHGSKPGILMSLQQAGITELSLFPEMSSLCKEIERKYLA